jgi:hypothetical protein
MSGKNALVDFDGSVVGFESPNKNDIALGLSLAFD